MSAVDEGQPLPPRVFEAHVVKVMLPGEGRAQATVENEAGTIRMLVPAGLVEKRFVRGERAGYFRAELDSDGILEIGDRLSGESW